MKSIKLFKEGRNSPLKCQGLTEEGKAKIKAFKGVYTSNRQNIRILNIIKIKLNISIKNRGKPGIWANFF